MKLLSRLTDLLFAPRAVCMGCLSVRGAEHEWLCARCQALLNPMYLDLESTYCARCGGVIEGGYCTRCADSADDVFMARAAYSYEPPVDQIVRSFKYRGAYRMDEWMGGEIVKMLKSLGMTDCDLVVPVPMHFYKKMRRGYNQAQRLARVVAKTLRIPYADALTRTRYTRAQSKLSGEARRNNLERAFRANAFARGKRVLLIDDVRTTGTTALKCAQALKAAGALRVTLATFAAAR